MASIFFEEGLCQGYNFRCNRVCPRIAKAEFFGSFFGGEFCWRFNGSAKWIARLARMFPVGVVDTPELPARSFRSARAHDGSSPQTTLLKMHQLHNVRSES